MRKFRELGGELRLRSGVSRMAVADGEVRYGRARRRQELEPGSVLSSAGWVETMRMCEDVSRPTAAAGRAAFVPRGHRRSLNAQPRELGHEHTIVFFNDSPRVPLAQAGRTGRRPQRRDLLAEQLCLRRAAPTKA